MNVTQPDAFLGHEMSCDNPCLSQLIFSSKVEKWACISVTDERNPFRRSFLTCYAAKSIAVSKLIDPTRVLKPDTGAYGVRNRRVSKLIDPMRVLKHLRLLSLALLTLPSLGYCLAISIYLELV